MDSSISAHDLHPTPGGISALKDEVVKMIEILSITKSGAKYFLKLCLNVLKEKPSSSNVAHLCFKLIKNDEELGYNFAIELGGCKFLFEQLSTSPTSSRPAYLAPVSSAILANIVSKTGVAPSSSGFSKNLTPSTVQEQEKSKKDKNLQLQVKS